MVKTFNEKDLDRLYVPPANSSKGQNGKVTIIGGSRLFHGAPLFSLVTASRFVDMVFFGAPEPSVGAVAERLKSRLFSFIWVPWKDTEEYIKKSDAVLIGPGLMRYRNDKSQTNGDELDKEGTETKKITEKFLKKFPDKKWVIDAGSLQVLNPSLIPNMAILTPNQKEYEMVFRNLSPETVAKKYNCIIVLKGLITKIFAPNKQIEIKGGNPGLTKGGSGDVEAGLVVSLLAKNDPLLSAASASYIVKKAADLLFKKVGVNFNSDDLAAKIPEVLKK